jgi:hypothetical protein
MRAWRAIFCKKKGGLLDAKICAEETFVDRLERCYAAFKKIASLKIGKSGNIRSNQHA